MSVEISERDLRVILAESARESTLRPGAKSKTTSLGLLSSEAHGSRLVLTTDEWEFEVVARRR
jgi:hypothetical protein